MGTHGYRTPRAFFTQGEMFLAFFLFSFVFCFSIGFPNTANAGLKTIYWPYFYFPPYFITTTPDKPSGMLIDVQNLIFKNIPEYNNIRIESSPGQSITSIQDNKCYCLCGILKQKLRERFLNYSLPFSLAHPPIGVIKTSTFKKIGNRSSISLTKLLNRADFNIGTGRGISCGSEIDHLLLLPHKNVTVFEGATYTKKGIIALKHGEIDMLLMVPEVFNCMSRNGNSTEGLETVKLEESNKYIVGYIAFPKNNFGTKVINKINTALVKIIDDGSLLQTYLKYVPLDQQTNFTLNFEELIIKPARKWEKNHRDNFKENSTLSVENKALTNS